MVQGLIPGLRDAVTHGAWRDRVQEQIEAIHCLRDVPEVPSKAFKQTSPDRLDPE